jgi:YVTN family beta-propeller protein
MNILIEKTLYCTSALTLMMASGMASATATALSGFIYTANERDASISEIASHRGFTDDSGQTAFVSNIEAGTVSAIDTSNQRAIETFKVGAGRNGITYRRN